jgi:hypothetical protein
MAKPQMFLHLHDHGGALRQGFSLEPRKPSAMAVHLYSEIDPWSCARIFEQPVHARIITKSQLCQQVATFMEQHAHEASHYLCFNSLSLAKLVFISSFQMGTLSASKIMTYLERRDCFKFWFAPTCTARRTPAWAVSI